MAAACSLSRSVLALHGLAVAVGAMPSRSTAGAAASSRVGRVLALMLLMMALHAEIHLSRYVCSIAK
jgi:hypothetical protein